MLHRSLLLSALLMLAGCASTAPGGGSSEPATPTHEVLQAAQLASYIDALQTLVQGSPAEQAEVLSAARKGYEQARQGPAVLRYALLLATPGHPSHDPQAAQRLLHEALARPDLLSAIERALAIVESARVEEELGLAAENARLVADAQQERDRQRNTAAPSPALAKRLQDEISQNARLRKELDEAQAKLQAIANIERNIPERPPVNEARKP